MADSKKSFAADIENPALGFISSAIPQERQPEPQRSIAAHRNEAKSKRLQLLIRPSLYRALKQRADEEGNSVNDLINQLLENATKKE